MSRVAGHRISREAADDEGLSATLAAVLGPGDWTEWIRAPFNEANKSSFYTLVPHKAAVYEFGLRMQTQHHGRAPTHANIHVAIYAGSTGDAKEVSDAQRVP